MKELIQALGKDIARLVMVLGFVIGLDASVEWAKTHEYTGGLTLKFLRACCDFCNAVEPKYALFLYVLGGLVTIASTSLLSVEVRKKRLSKSADEQKNLLH